MILTANVNPRRNNSIGLSTALKSEFRGDRPLAFLNALQIYDI
jgi:hypothetical protein